MPISPRQCWHGTNSSAKVERVAIAGGHAMSGTGLRNLSLVLLVMLIAYVAWSGGA